MARLVPVVLALTIGLVVLPPAPARADGDEALERLTNRVEMLLDLVAELRSEVVEPYMCPSMIPWIASPVISGVP